MKNKQESSLELLVALNVIDNKVYQEYRNNMTPILTSHGGYFGYDFMISEVLITETDNKINRVFTIRFPNKEKMEAFFLDKDYNKVKE
jgi:uncharacterized protein (DUF1330 family)